MSYQYRTIEVDKQGRSCIAAVNGDEKAEVGSYGNELSAEDEVVLADGTVWTIDKVYTYIQTGAPGFGASNYVAVALVQRD